MCIADLCEHSAADELCGGVPRGIVWYSVTEVADECNAERVVVVSAYVSALIVPTTTLVHSAILTNQEIVTDIPPTCRRQNI